MASPIFSCPDSVCSSGGGVGGLTCALALSKYPDIDVVVYEAAAKFEELGAGIGLWPRELRR
jgi:salicylate hydroxylase